MDITEIRAALERVNIRRMAADLEIHPNTLYNIKEGRNQPSFDTAQKIIEYLKNLGQGGRA